MLRDAPTRICGLAVFAECLADGLACGDQRRLTGSGSALEALRDDAIYKSTFTLLYFTMGHHSHRTSTLYDHLRLDISTHM